MNRPPWKVRRRIIIATLLFCGGCVIYLMGFGADNELNRLIVQSCFFLSGTIIATYVLGASWDDLNVMSKMGPKAYQEAPAIVPEGWPSDIALPEPPKGAAG